MGLFIDFGKYLIKSLRDVAYLHTQTRLTMNCLAWVVKHLQLPQLAVEMISL